MRRSTSRARLGTVAGAAVLALLAGCASGAPEPRTPVDLGQGEPGPAEDTQITLAIPFPDVTMHSMYAVGTELGHYAEEGLSVEVITADNVAAAVSSGSADVGVESAGSVIEAIRGGVEVDALSGHFCRQNFDFATQPGVTAIDQLNGTNVVLAGTSGDPAEFQRALALREAGWDLDSVDAEIVYPGPDSATWREFFVTDRVSLIPFYGDDRPALEEYGAEIIVESLQNWPNDLQIAGSGWLAENPNSAVRFLRATMKAAEYIVAPGAGHIPANKDSVLDIYEKHGFDVADLRVQNGPWVLDGHLTCPNLYFGEEAWNTTIETQKLQPLDFAAHVDLAYLERAQGLLGIGNDVPSELTYP
ncbi:ABC transporter substrate-binding protein [Pseudonocardia kunmingensis]|uniref:NitT/TauT family transport system substrate-binding protein n=1 Tax=Pseudonocardia kunmingensis TaxID=630975 RepID=A0A543DQJ6_9PSEU|nr:ABC transporter substrate-binding protein [Pseudonocardia kunmingensis]TQM11595.1 NitT/TauT family transport system substrate-binding protein [Pseudonocardia kunmingensis]